MRKRALETAGDAVHSLEAIVKLVKEQGSMKVGRDVQGQVRSALRELKLADSHSPFLPLSLHHAKTAQTLASKAFFNPSMLALLYFPDEHKYAVYTPLFGPISVPLLVAALAEVKAWRKRREERKKQEKEKKVE